MYMLGVQIKEFLTKLIMKIELVKNKGVTQDLHQYF